MKKNCASSRKIQEESAPSYHQHLKNLEQIRNGKSRFKFFSETIRPLANERENRLSRITNVTANKTLNREARCLSQPKNFVSVHEQVSKSINQMLKEKRKRDLVKIGVENDKFMTRIINTKSVYPKTQYTNFDRLRLKYLNMRCEYPVVLD